MTEPLVFIDDNTGDSDLECNRCVHRNGPYLKPGDDVVVVFHGVHVYEHYDTVDNIELRAISDDYSHFDVYHTQCFAKACPQPPAPLYEAGKQVNIEQYDTRDESTMWLWLKDRVGRRAYVEVDPWELVQCIVENLDPTGQVPTPSIEEIKALVLNAYTQQTNPS